MKSDVLVRIFALLAGPLAVIFGSGPHQAQAKVDYVIHISVDALRGDKLRDIVGDNPANFPNFRRLETQGSFTYNARSDFGYTETVPNHITMITGRPVSQPAGMPNTVHHGYSNNFPGAADTIHANGNAAVPYKMSTFDVVHDNGLSTNLFTSKTRLAILDRSYTATTGAVDTVGADNGRDKIDFSSLVDGSSAGITTDLATSLGVTPRNYTFIHLVEPDTVGHASGWNGQAWIDSVKVIDNRLAAIFAAIDASATLSGHTAIVLTGDHGGGVSIHVDPTAYVNYNVPIFVWGGGLPAGSNLYAHATNRFDPALTRPDYNAAQQPWRNGDTGNLSLALLGLPPIPGSLMQPNVPVLAVPEPNTISLVGTLLAAVGYARFRRRTTR